MEVIPATAVSIHGKTQSLKNFLVLPPICSEEHSLRTDRSRQLIHTVYYAHMIHLGKRSAPLIKNKFLAWKHGPVALGLYEHVNRYGADEIPLDDGFGDVVDLAKMKNCEAEAVSLQEAYDKLRDFTAGQLVNASHDRNGAWYKTLRMGKVEIPDGFIEDEYSVCSIIQ